MNIIHATKWIQQPIKYARPLQAYTSIWTVLTRIKTGTRLCSW